MNFKDYNTIILLSLTLKKYFKMYKLKLQFFIDVKQAAHHYMKVSLKIRDKIISLAYLQNSLLVKPLILIH